MTIYKNDIKLFESKVMTDEEDGGGAMTNVEIVSGEHNSIFPDISDLDRAYGVVNIRSIHLKVDSDNDETYFGATIGVSDIPADPNVSVTLMSINDPYATRSESQKIIESYLAKSTKYSGELYSTQLIGQRSIRIIQRENIKAPVVGDVLVLFNKTYQTEQFVKIVSVSSQVEYFTSSPSGGTLNYSRLVVTCEISEPLRDTYVGVAANPYDYESATTAIYESTVADAAEYYSMKPLTENADFGASAVQVESVYTQLVPSTRIETPHVNKPMAEIVNVLVEAGNGVTAEVPMTIETQQISIDLANQGYVYTQTLVPVPDAGTLTISYMVQGSWYELKDNGDGTLSGSSASYGTAQYDSSGNLSVTLGALPDVNSIILMQYAQASSYLKFIGEIDYTREIELTLPQHVNLHACTITWGADKVATIVDGIISGDATGVMDTTKSCILIPNQTPASDTVFMFEWDDYLSNTTLREKVTSLANYAFVADISGQLKLQLPQNLSEQRLSITLNVKSSLSEKLGGEELYVDRAIKLYDDGLGNIRTASGSNAANIVVGSVNYASGEVLIQDSFEIDFVKRMMTAYTVTFPSIATYYRQSGTVITTVAIKTLTTSTNVEVTATDVSDNGSVSSIFAGETEVLIPSVLATIDNYEQAIASESVSFVYNGRTLKESGGVLYDGTSAVGTLNLTSGEILLNTWSIGSGNFEIKSGLVYNGVAPKTQSLTFLTAGNPVVSRSLQVNAKNYLGETINATTDDEGLISGENFTGYINTDLGIVTIYSNELLDTTSLYYNCVSYSYLPLSADILGLDTIKLPSDGRVICYRAGDVCVINQDEEVLVAVTANQVLQLPHIRLADLSVTGAEYSADLDAGTITFESAGNVTINYRFEDMFLVTSVDISGVLKTSRPLSHAYEANKAKVASVIVSGNLFARYTNLFDQKTWTGVFNDKLIGEEAPVAYNDTLYPVNVTNDGCITERMAIVFTSSTNFKLVGENIGQIAVGDINTTFAPINPVSGKPYFTLNYLGWGSGWSTNNVLRIDFFGAVYQLNLIRTVLQGDSISTLESDKFALQIRGNINKDI